MCAKYSKTIKKCETYPTRNGIAVPLTELWLPSSDLNLEKETNFNNHHNCWTEKAFGKFIIFKTLRDLESHQFVLPTDVHEYLHKEYDPPELPTIKQAITEIERAKDAKERLHVLKKIDRKRAYIYEEISDQVMSQVIGNYNELKRQNTAQ
ncbi:MAG: hypothetical protein WBI29_02510 [Candidatus Saccharimonadales bacterium]